MGIAPLETENNEVFYVTCRQVKAQVSHSSQIFFCGDEAYSAIFRHAKKEDKYFSSSDGWRIAQVRLERDRQGREFLKFLAWAD
jgi:hypothetical protein